MLLKLMFNFSLLPFWMVGCFDGEWHFQQYFSYIITFLDKAQANHIYFRTVTTKGLFLPGLLKIGLVVAEEDFLMMFCLYMYICLIAVISKNS